LSTASTVLILCHIVANEIGNITFDWGTTRRRCATHIAGEICKTGVAGVAEEIIFHGLNWPLLESDIVDGAASKWLRKTVNVIDVV